MIGQTKLLQKLNTYTLDTFPRSVMLIGERGIGKHTIVNHVQANILHLPLIDISTNISDEYIDAIYRNPNPAIYLIDLSQLTEKEQNIILKFIEEPLNNSFIIILAENRANVLGTVLNRCVIFDFEPYTKDELENFATDIPNRDLALKVLRTPGKILAANTSNIQEIYNVCEKIVSKLNAASYPNTLSIASKVNFKDQYNKFDLDMFFDILEYSLFSHYLQTDNKNIYAMYLLTGEQRKKLLDKRLNKEVFFQAYLTKLWKVARGL